MPDDLKPPNGQLKSSVNPLIESVPVRICFAMSSAFRSEGDVGRRRHPRDPSGLAGDRVHPAREADRLRLEVRLEALGAELPPHARRLEAAERAAEVEREPVDRERPRPDLLRDVERLPI